MGLKFNICHPGIGWPNVNKMDPCRVISLMELNKNIVKVRDTYDDHDDMTP